MKMRERERESEREREREREAGTYHCGLGVVREQRDETKHNDNRHKRMLVFHFEGCALVCTRTRRRHCVRTPRSRTVTPQHLIFYNLT